MRKLILSLIPLALMLTACNKQTVDSNSYKEDETFEFKYTDDVLASGDLYINDSSGKVKMYIPYLSNNYDLPYHMRQNDTDFEIKEIKGSNISLLDVEYIKSSFSKSRIDDELMVSDLMFNVSTKCTESKDVHIEKFVYTHEDSTYYTNTDITIHIVPDAEFINSEDGTTLFKESNYVMNFGESVYSFLYFSMDFKNASVLLPTEEDYFMINNLSLKSNGIDSYEIEVGRNNYETLIKFNSSDSSDINCKVYTMGETAIPLYSVTVKLDFIPEKTKYVYYSLVMTYSLSYDETPRTMILSDVLYNNDDSMLDAYYEVFN